MTAGVARLWADVVSMAVTTGAFVGFLRRLDPFNKSPYRSMGNRRGERVDDRSKFRMTKQSLNS